MNVAIVAPGEMGSAMARELKARGARVLTSVEGRSQKSVERANAAGFEVLSDIALVNQSEIFLSVVPPGSAVALARRFAPLLSKSIVYVDCNAIAPKTNEEIHRTVAASGAQFVDAAIFGGPTSGKPGTVLYVSGPSASRLTVLEGVKVKVLEAPVGAAKALKLSFAGINKGFTALGAAMALTALRTGCAQGVLEQLAETQPALLAYLSKFVPAMLPKAYRWQPEMGEIAEFLEDDPALAAIFESMGKIYGDIANASDHELLKEFCSQGMRMTEKKTP